MNRVISSIWGKLEEKTQRGGGGGDGVGGYSKGKVVKYKTWCGTVEKKAQALLSLFKLLDASDAEKKEKFGIISTKVTLAINEFISMLQTTTFKNSDSGSHHNSSSSSGSGNNSSNSGSNSSNSSNSNSSASSLQDNIRATLLEVWNPLLQSLGKLELADVMAVAAVHKAVLLLMAREEFSCEALLNSITSSSSTPKEISANKDVIVRYRAMLITTLYAATSRLVDKPNPSVFSTTTATNSMNNMVFASKVLAILYWRLPQQVGQAISKILEIPDMELLAPVLSFPAFPDDHPTSSPRAQTLPQPFHGHGHGPSHHVAGLHRTTISSGSGSNNSNTNTNTNTNSNNSGTASNSSSSSSLDLNSSSSSLGTSNGVSARNSSNINSNVKGSPLFGWTDLYKEVPPMESYLQKDNGPWLAVLAKFDVTYITFFKEWILHVTSVIPGKVEWTSITGFPRLLQSLLYQMRTKEQPPPPLTKPYPLLELQYLLLNQTHAELIDAYIKAAFLRTNVFDLLSVLNTINLTEGWFSEMNEHDYSLPKTFDINFFCSGLEILLETDHHQTLLRVITLVYNFSELFEGQHRAALFDVLLTKQFYQLFMHWDPGVRNAYQQLLIFKMVRIKRSTLYNDGYVVKEMARVGVTSYQSSKESGPDGQGNGNNSGPFSSLLSTRSGSGFFSTFSNVLPSIFSLSAPPSDDASPSSPPPTTTTATNSNGTDSSNGNQGNGVLPSSHRDSSSTSSSTTTPTKPTPQTNSTTPTTPTTASTNSVNPYIKMGIERTSSGPLNGTKPGNNDNSNATSSSTSSTSPSTSSTSPSSSASTSTSTSNGNLDVDEFYDMESGSSGHPTAADDVKKHHSGAAVTIGDDAAKSVDVQLFLKLNSYLKIIEDQLRKPNAKKAFDARLEAYAPYALAEFNQHLARYHQWELKNESPPRLMSLPFLRMGEG